MQSNVCGTYWPASVCAWWSQITGSTAWKRFGSWSCKQPNAFVTVYKSSSQSHMQVLGIIKRNFVMNDEEDFRLLFNGYVRPHLEYCVQVWSPYLKKDIECLEKFNCSLSLHLLQTFKGLKNEPYSERLALLHTSSLAKRRVRGDLIQAYRIIRNW